MKNIDRLPFPGLLTKLKNYSDDMAFKYKVRRVHMLCLRSGRIALADKIQSKYRQHFPTSDLVMALAWSLKADQK